MLIARSGGGHGWQEGRAFQSSGIGIAGSSQSLAVNRSRLPSSLEIVIDHNPIVQVAWVHYTELVPDAVGGRTFSGRDAARCFTEAQS